MTTTTPKKPKVTNAALAAKLKEHGQLINALRDDHEVLRRHVNDLEHALASRAILEKRIEDTTKYLDGKLQNLAENLSRELHEGAAERITIKNDQHQLRAGIAELDTRLNMRCQDIEKSIENGVTTHNLLVGEMRAVSTKLDSARSHLVKEVERAQQSSSNALPLCEIICKALDAKLVQHYARLNKHQEQLDLFGHDIANLYGAHGDLPGVEKLIAENAKAAPAVPDRKLYASVLMGARGIITRKPQRHETAIGALEKVCTGSLLAHAVDELYDAVDFVFTLPFRNDPEMKHEERVKVLDAWSERAGLGDIVIAFDIAIQRCST